MAGLDQCVPPHGALLYDRPRQTFRYRALRTSCQVPPRGTAQPREPALTACVGFPRRTPQAGPASPRGSRPASAAARSSSAAVVRPNWVSSVVSCVLGAVIRVDLSTAARRYCARSRAGHVDHGDCGNRRTNLGLDAGVVAGGGPRGGPSRDSVAVLYSEVARNPPQWLETGRCSPQCPITIFCRSPSQWK